MLNSYNIKHETTVTPVTRVVEKTITPDKVTDMYDSVREQVGKDVIASIRVESNVINGVVMQLNDSVSDRTSHIFVRFTLNGKNYEFKDVLPTHERLAHDALCQVLRKIISSYNFISGYFLSFRSKFEKFIRE